MSLNSEIFVDKSELLDVTNRYVNTQQRFMCVSRPRRFGKSMAADMLAAYYDCGDDTEELFEGLSISQCKSYRKHLNQYDVLKINMQEFLSRSDDVEGMLTLMQRRILSDLKQKYPEYVREEDLVFAMQDVYSHTKRSFVILIDEWDCLFCEYQQDQKAQKKYLDFLRAWLKDQDNVAFAYMTGILPIKKYGSHSALNMFTEYSMTEPGELAAYFGFTENEVKNLCMEYGMDFEEAKAWYDGYGLITHKQDRDICYSMYSPKSVVEAMLRHKFGTYWNQTETYEALKVYIQMNMDGLKDAIVGMLAGESIRINTGTFSNDMTTFATRDDILTLLVHLGYLTYDGILESVSIPNKEVSKEYVNAISTMDWKDEFERNIIKERGEGHMKSLLILGAGGFGQMVKETAIQLGYEEVVFLDDAAFGKDVVGKCCDYMAKYGEYKMAVAAFGNNHTRLFWTDKLLEAGYEVPSIVHPSAIVSPSAVLGPGCFIMQRAVVNTHTHVDRAALVNSGAVVDHDSVVCAGAHVGLGSVVKANCTIEQEKKVEAGEVIFSTRRKIEGVDSRALEDALYAFGFGPQCSYVKPFGEGHINETYAVYMPMEDGTEKPLYVLQRININVFKEPGKVMENIFGVTEFLRDVIRREGGDPDRETLAYIKTKSGETYFEDDEGQPWRCANFIANSVCYQMVERPEQFYQSARSFGHFLKQLGEYPAESLYETIPNFHDTVKRFEAFAQAVERDVKNRARLCRSEIEFALAREKDCGALMSRMEAGVLPLRVTHNDTKLNNILFDAESGKGLCIIDLDTIMPGLAANDFGDSIRFGASTAEEDERDLDKVHFDINLYELYVKGYLEMARDVLTPEELESLPWGARLMTFECGIRFLMDFLQGDTYFKTAYPEHNLVRARTQFRLVQEMEDQFDEMCRIVREC